MLPCLPWPRLDSFMSARAFCLGWAAWVPAAKVTVWGKALLGPPKSSLRMSKLRSTSSKVSPGHAMSHLSFLLGGKSPLAFDEQCLPDSAPTETGCCQKPCSKLRRFYRSFIKCAIVAGLDV